MKRAIRKLLENSGLQFADLEFPTTTRAKFRILLGSGKHGLEFTIRKHSSGLGGRGVPRIHINARSEWCDSFIRSYSADFDRWHLEFKQWVKDKVLPAHEERYKDQQEEKRIAEQIAEIKQGDPRISVEHSTYGTNGVTIQFELGDFTEAAKLADFYREYFNGTPIPAGWYYENGQYTYDYARFRKEKNAKHAAEVKELATAQCVQNSDHAS